MKKICIIDSTFPINTRTKKIEESFVSVYGRENVFVIAWNRDDRQFTQDNEHFIYSSKAAYGSKIQKLRKLNGFKEFIKKQLGLLNCDYIVASHWDVLLLSFLVSKRKNIIYDDLDMPTHKLLVVRQFLRFIEKLSLKKSCAILFASRFFIPHYHYYSGEKILLENKPSQNFLPCKMREGDGKLIITFLGVIRYFEILKNLVDAVTGLNNVILKIYGDGHCLDKLVDYSQNKPNIEIFGRYENSKLQLIYDESDTIWAAYPSRDFNVKFAISNKFHETLMFNKPGIFSEGTELGNFVISEKIGFTVNPYSTESIRNCIEHILSDKNLLINTFENIKHFPAQSSWNDDFSKLISLIDKNLI